MTTYFIAIAIVSFKTLILYGVDPGTATLGTLCILCFSVLVALWVFCTDWYNKRKQIYKDVVKWMTRTNDSKNI